MLGFRHYELIAKFSVGLKTLLHEDLLEREFHGDFDNKFKKFIVFVVQLIIIRYRHIGYTLHFMQ